MTKKKQTTNKDELLTLSQIGLLPEFNTFSLTNLKEYLEGVGLQKFYLMRTDNSKLVAYKKSDIEKLRKS